MSSALQVFSYFGNKIESKSAIPWRKRKKRQIFKNDDFFEIFTKFTSKNGQPVPENGFFRLPFLANRLFARPVADFVKIGCFFSKNVYQRSPNLRQIEHNLMLSA